jgi:UPF0176 protein
MILSFYKFITIHDTLSLKIQLYKICLGLKCRGTVIIAPEGVNLNLEGEDSKIYQLQADLKKIDVFRDVEFRLFSTKQNAFDKLKIKIKKEIITAKITNLDVSKNTGEYLSPREWNQLTSLKEVMVIDARNFYEYAMGTFLGSVNTKIQNFSELKKWLDSHLKSVDKDKKIAMFCTGGIRCEKSTAYLKQQGFQNVYHLKGGILSYIDCNDKLSGWIGKCFLFDNRITYNKSEIIGPR